MIYFKFNARIFIIKFYSQQILEYTFVYLYIYIWKESSLKNKLLAKKKKKKYVKKKTLVVFAVARCNGKCVVSS